MRWNFFKFAQWTFSKATSRLLQVLDVMIWFHRYYIIIIRLLWIFNGIHSIILAQNTSQLHIFNGSRPKWTDDKKKVGEKENSVNAQTEKKKYNSCHFLAFLFEQSLKIHIPIETLKSRQPFSKASPPSTIKRHSIANSLFFSSHFIFHLSFIMHLIRSCRKS